MTVPTNHGHRPIIALLDGRALGRACARCTTTGPFGTVFVRWPCTTARILGVAVAVPCDRCQQHRPYLFDFNTLDGRALRLCVRCWSDCQDMRARGHYIDAAEAISAASDDELVAVLVHTVP